MALTQVKTLGIADDAVTLAKQAAGTDGQIITYDASGNPTAVGPGTDGQVLTSTGSGSPPAFEDAAASVGGATGVDFNDSVKIRLGTGNDLEIYHDGHNRIVCTQASQDLYIAAEQGEVYIQTDFGAKNAIACHDSAQVDLYHNNTKKFETTSSGVALSSAGENKLLIGSTDANGATIVLDGDSNGDGSGTDFCYIQHGTDGDLSIHCDNPNNNADFELYVKDGSEKAIVALADGAVELHHNHIKQFETQADGIKVKGAYSATAGANPCRAWGNIDGDAGTLAFRGEQGCSSITDSGTGQYTCTLDSSSPDTNGSVTTSVRVNSTAAQQWYLVYGMWTDINQIEIGARLIDNNDDSFAIADVDLCLFSAFR